MLAILPFPLFILSTFLCSSIDGVSTLSGYNRVLFFAWSLTLLVFHLIIQPILCKVIFCILGLLSVVLFPICPSDLCSIFLSLLASFSISGIFVLSCFPSLTHKLYIALLFLGGYPNDFNIHPWLIHGSSIWIEALPISCSASSSQDFGSITRPSLALLLYCINSTCTLHARVHYHKCLLIFTQVLPFSLLFVLPDSSTFLLGVFSLHLKNLF